MVRKVANRIEEHDLSEEVAAVPVTETTALPVSEDEATALPMPESESETTALPILVSEDEATALPILVSESETTALPIPESENEVPSDEDDLDRQDVKSLELKIAELEDKFAKLLVELNTFVNKKMKKQDSKEKIVKCKCKGKKVKLAKCKCKSKKKAK